MSTFPVQLDGITLEGGGQLLRLALSLSSLTRIPIHVNRIRGNRSKDGGLKTAHLAGVQWLAYATAAQTEGMELKSKELIFRPSSSASQENHTVWQDTCEDGQVTYRHSHIAMSTPGSILLVLQAILPYLLFCSFSKDTPAPIRITIEGGTNVSNSPSIEYVTQVLLPLLSTKVGIPPIATTLHKRGWSMGRIDVGSVTFEVHPLHAGAKIPAFSFQGRGELVQVHVSILAPDAKIRGFVKGKVTAHLLVYKPGIEIHFPVDENSGHDKRLYLLLVAETSDGFKLGRDWLYDRKLKGSSTEEFCELLVTKVMKELKQELKHGCCVDEYMQDQLVVFQALAAGCSEVDGGKDRKPSLHTQTARWVAEQVLGTRVVFDDAGKCEGMGFCVGKDGLRRTEDDVDDTTNGIGSLTL